jgi:hypothetical protein
MSQATSPQAAAPLTPTARAAPQAARLLMAGVLAGPLFLTAWALQAFTRSGFDPGRHPLSLLSLGDLGWIQITSFVVTGALFVICAVGLRRVLHPGPGGTWGPRLVGAFGAGLIVSGVFVTDAGAGYPAGAPAGAPTMTWHGGLHGLGYVIAMLSWTAACIVLRRRFAATAQRRWARTCVAIIAAVLVLIAWPDSDSYTIRITIATAVQFGFIAAVATRLTQHHSDTTTTSTH